MGIKSFVNIILLLVISALPIKSIQANDIFIPEIQAGLAKLSGTIKGDGLKSGKESILYLLIYYPISGERGEYKTTLDKNGHFYIEAETEMNNSIALLRLSNPESSLMIGLNSEKETILDLSYDKEGNLSINTTCHLPLTTIYDRQNSLELMMKAITYQSFIDTIRFYNEPPDFYKASMVTEMNFRINEFITSNDNLSPFAIKYLSDEFKLFWLNNTLFNYERMMIGKYRSFNKTKENDIFTVSAVPNISYYSFLKEIDLNDPFNLYCQDYNKFMENILMEEALDIPSIQETPVNIWIENVSKILADQLKIEKGFFYDLIAAQSYSTQLRNSKIPLNDRQINNIRVYFKENGIAETLLRQNETLLNQHKYETLIKTTPSVDKENLMDAIIASYKGNIGVSPTFPTKHPLSNFIFSLTYT